jgi:PAS domain S-box-containing protein
MARHLVQTEQNLPQLRPVLESIHDGLIVLDGSWLCTYVNKAAAAFLQTTPDELTGKTIWEAFPEPERSRLYREFTFAADHHELVKIEEYFAPLHRWYECRCYPINGGLTLFLVDITERKSTEEALKRSRTVLLQAGKMANLGAWSIELTYNVDEINRNPLQWCDEVYRIFGYEPGSVEVTNDLFFQRVHPEDRQRIVDAVARALVDHQPYEIEHRIIRPDGAERIVLERAEIEFDDQGRPLRMVGAVQDITERKRVEQALRDSEHCFRAVLENSLDVAYRRDLQRNRYEYISPVVEKVLGFSPQEMRELPVEQVLGRIHPEDAQRVRKELSQVMARGEGGLEYRFQRKDGQYCWLADHLVVERNGTSRPLYLTGVVRDVTGQKQMEEELRKWNDRLSEQVRCRTAQLTSTVSQLRDEITRRAQAEGELQKSSQMLEGFFEHTITPLAFMDRGFNFVRVNEAYARADGKTPEYFVGKNHFELYPDEDNQAIFDQVVQTKRPYRAYARPFAYPRDPHRLTYWNWQLTPLLNDAGEVQSLVLNLEDVTEQQRAYQELEQRTRQLQHLAMELSQAEDRERKHLAELLHDDLQQLLAAAKFQLGLLSSRFKNEEMVQEMAGEIKQVLIEAIGKSRGLSHELSPPVLGQSDLCEIFEWMGEQMKAKHGLTVHLDILCPIHVDHEPLRAFLYKTVQEMLFNVVKHANVREARLRVRRVNGHLWLCVSDKGRGFDPRELGRTPGFGLLSVRERIELLGGRMRIKSTPGKGSIFVISVPDPGAGKPKVEPIEGVIETALPAPVVRKKRAKRAADKRVRVLLADDHRVMREGLAAMLDEEHDIEVIGQAGNGREAVDLACQFAPDVVIMDVAMPVMAGDEATRQIKRHLPNTRIIALSMFEDGHVSKRMHRAGAETYLSKTGPSEELLAAIRGSL